MKLINCYDNEEYELQINDMEQKIKEYQDIINDKDKTEPIPNRICTVCFEEYTQNRKKVVYTFSFLSLQYVYKPAKTTIDAPDTIEASNNSSNTIIPIIVTNIK